MGFLNILSHAMREAVPFVVIGPLLLVPFIIAEQLRPVHRRPGWRDYGMNILISTTTLFLSMPLAVLAGMGSAALRQHLPWQPISFTYSDIAAVPRIGGALELLAMIFVPILIHDLWFYWAHRIEHRVPLLWEFHKLHHSDELTNCSTWARDHFLQSAWIAVFPAITLGLVFDIKAAEAGMAGILSMMVLSFLSMFYHSAIRVQVPWLDRVLVTPQVHRIHHSSDPAYFNRNYADAFPVMDMLFGTYQKPQANVFAETGLGLESPAPRSLWAAQAFPVVRGLKRLAGSQEQEV